MLYFGKKTSGVVALQHTGLCWKSVPPAPLRATFFFIHPLQVALCNDTLIVPRLQGLLRGCTQTLGTAHTGAALIQVCP